MKTEVHLPGFKEGGRRRGGKAERIIHRMA